MILYQLFLFIILFFSFPLFIYQIVRYGKYRKSVLYRLGFSFPNIKKNGNQLIWIHAVSVGESRAIAKLAKDLKREYPNTIFVISNITETGHDEAKKTMPFADYFVFLPLDLALLIRRLMKRVQPDLVILVETDFWYSFLYYAKKNRSKIIVVNGKVSEKSAKRYRLFKFFANKILSLVDIFCVQNELYKKRFESIGIPSNKILVTGNLKFDAVYSHLSPSELITWKHNLGLGDEESDLILTIGSTHASEEEGLLNHLKPLLLQFPKLKILLVPRHPERFDAVAQIIKQRQIPFVRLTQIKEKAGTERVILIDQMGLLTQCYELSKVAIVAGSFIPSVGGHNVLEPSYYGVPVLFGPHMENQLDMVELIKKFGAGYQVCKEDIAETIKTLLTDAQVYKRVSISAKRLIAEIGGAVKSTESVIKSNILTK